MRFDDSRVAQTPEYTYNSLPGDKKRIRLLKLYPGEGMGMKIYCELMEDPDEEQMKEDEAFKERVKSWEEIRKKEVKYEALSWCWGNEEEDYVIIIKAGEREFKKRVRKELALALKYLRRAGQERTLWIDAICIDQANPNERNHQVQMMSRVYTRALQVCIWLGEADDDSEIAMNFIREDIKELKNFDLITSDEQYSRKWQALMSLMQRDWFFRRWVIQEIALAGAAMVYCGPYSVPWKSFAVAVELFVEVETATHRLSEVMKRDEKFRHVPGWFEYVSELGASLLVQATGKRKEEEEEIVRQRLKETQTIDPLERRSLLSLEYLVSTMFTFQASEPRDVIYALLAIARDASPFAPAHYGQEDKKLFLVITLLDDFLAEKPFVVDYNRPYSDVSKDFVEFSIERMHKIDPYQELDILCRPWALDPSRERSRRLKGSDGIKKVDHTLIRKRKPAEWKRKTGINGTPEWNDDPRSTEEYFKAAEWGPTADAGNENCNDPKRWTWQQRKARFFPEPSSSEPRGGLIQGVQDITLPSWVSRASQAPFILDHAPGIDMRKTSRANADPLVGPPLDGHRNYNASGSEKLDLKALKFRKRPVMLHHSLYVKGFELDIIAEVEDASQMGGIPSSWLELGGWQDVEKDPPDEFWRTLVADRGRDNKNPPYYYARACKESVHKGSHRGGSVNTGALIHDEQNSIIAEFCRRVHAVIWNRSLFRTKNNRLGLESKVRQGDKVCIIYGCTVPVIVRETKKWKKENGDNDAREERDLEDEEDRVEKLKALIQQAVRNRERKGKYRPKKKLYQVAGVLSQLHQDKIAAQAALDTLTKDEEAAVEAAEVEDFNEAARQIDGENAVDESANGEGIGYRCREASDEPVEGQRNPKDFWYEFKGECYLHGMMDGEAMREKFYNGLRDWTFELR
ncbi:heterokaryon incompatibility protein-domain-containing protein [Rhexocercosporidium sp. MPI-PUGE-AT-0058]|nr:heterokaryon incompatibility protein-domain-containing protein [Rhexocercosporidium sp. MPI-PUGE-AT-0058]